MMKNLIRIAFIGVSLIHQTVATGANVFTYERTVYNPGTIQSFGISLADAGGNLLIGNVYGDVYQASTGTAFLFNARTGQQIRQLVNPSPIAGDLFGRAVGVQGNNLLVGAPGTAGKPGGAVFEYDGQTGQFLRSISNPAGAVNDRFGWALTAIGDNIIVGTPELRTGTQYNGPGRVYVVDGTSGGLVRTINNPHVNPSPSNEDSFGQDVAPYGNDILVGALYDDNGGKVFQVNSQDGSFVRTFDNPDGSLGNGNRPQFGVAIDVLGDYLLVGANQSSASGVNATGAAYLFDLRTGGLVHRFFDPTSQVLGNFGISVALLDDYAIVAAPYDDNEGTNGSVYVFDIDSGSLLQTIKTPLGWSTRFGLEVERVGTDLLAITDTANAGRVHIYSIPEPSASVLCLTAMAMLGVLRRVWRWKR
jgi:hypothetical protein